MTSLKRPGLIRDMLICIVMITAPVSVMADLQQDQLTAALIYKTYPYVTFVHSDSETVPTFCFLGQHSYQVANELSKKVELGIVTQEIIINQLISLEDVEDHQCNILYTAPAVRLHRKEVRRLSLHTLTISDNSEFNKNGSILSITFHDNKPTLGYSLSNLKTSKVKLRSTLLRHLTKYD